MSKHILTLDIGSSTVTMAEFALQPDHSLELVNYGVKALGLGPEDEDQRAVYTSAAISELIAELGVKPGAVQLSISGQHVFSRYVKLPPVSGDKINQIVEYEAKQNVPYPLDEVVWDRQILSSGDGELDVLLAAVKQDVLEGLTEVIGENGLEPHLVDISTATIMNAVRYNYGDTDECIMVLDLGARTTNLIFLEGDRAFSRTVPVSGNTITQQIARDFELSFEQANQAKEEISMVALGGAYEPLEDRRADQVSKCIRSVMTRMHAEINKSISHYRIQQGGSAPAQILLTGGGSVLQYLDIFLEEKLNIPVTYLNPVQEVGVAAHIPDDQIAADIHMLAESVGLALRSAGSCHLELNLLPPSVARERILRQKQGFVMGSLAMLAVAAGLWAFAGQRDLQQARETLEARTSELKKLEQWAQKVGTLKQQIAEKELHLSAVGSVVAERGEWIELLDAITSRLPDNVWVSQLRPVPDKPDHLLLIGSFFQDAFYQPDWRNHDNAAITVFRDALREVEIFGDEERNLEVKVLRSPRPLSSDQEGGGIHRHVFSFMIEVPVKGGLPQ